MLKIELVTCLLESMLVCSSTSLHKVTVKVNKYYNQSQARP